MIFIRLLILSVMLISITHTVHAKELETRPDEKIAKEDVETAEMMEMLELLDMLDELEFMQDMDLLIGGEGHAKKK